MTENKCWHGQNFQASDIYIYIYIWPIAHKKNRQIIYSYSIYMIDWDI